MPRLNFYQGPVTVGAMAQPPIPPSSQPLTDLLGKTLGGMVVNGTRAVLADDGDTMASGSAAPGALPAAGVAASAPPAQGSSLGKTLGSFARGAVFGGVGANPQRQGQNLMDRATAGKTLAETQAQQAVLQRSSAAASEMTAVMQQASTALKTAPDVATKHSIIADAITQSSLIGQKYQVPPEQFHNGFTQWLNVNDPDGSLAAAFMNGASGSAQASGTFYNEPQRQGEATTASNLKAQEATASYKQALDTQAKQNEGTARVANISGGYGVKERQIEAGATTGAASIAAGTSRANNQATINAEAPLRASTAEKTRAETQYGLAKTIAGLIPQGIREPTINKQANPNYDPKAAGLLQQRAGEYMTRGDNAPSAMAKALADLVVGQHGGFMGLGDRDAAIRPLPAPPAARGPRLPLTAFERRPGQVIHFDRDGNPLP